MSRRWLITVSLLAHAALAVGLFVTGVWRLERLDSDRHSLASLAVMTPPAPAPEGGPSSKFEQKLIPKEKKKKVVSDTQLVVKRDETPEVATTHPGDGEGSGTGSGTGSGHGTTGACLDHCGDAEASAPVCGNGSRETGETCDDGNTASGDGCSATCQTEPAPKKAITIVPPTVLTSIRISGDTQIVPPDVVKQQMMRDDHLRTLGVLKVCISTSGDVASVALLSSTKYPDYDQRLLAGVRGWRYRPYLVEGSPVPVCSTVTFVFTIK